MEDTRAPPGSVRRLGAWLFGSLLLIVLASAVSAGLELVPRACGCASTPSPSPGWTPWPVTRDDASRLVARLSNTPVDRSDVQPATVGGRAVWLARGAAAIGYVDSLTGVVLLVVTSAGLPNGDGTSVPDATARTTAELFLARSGISTAGLGESDQLVQRSIVAWNTVAWTANGADRPTLEVYVNTASGQVFAYRNLASDLGLEVPVIGHDAAMTLAGRSRWAGGRSPDPADQPVPEFYGLDTMPAGPDGHSWWWNVYGLGPGNSLFVDAVTGEVSATWFGNALYPKPTAPSSDST